MANIMLQNIPTVTSIAEGDKIPFTSAPGGTPVSKNITIENLLNYYDSRRYDTLELADAAAVAAGKLLVIAQNHTLTANTVLASPIMRIPGGSFTQPASWTLTINGSFSNPSNGQCFIGFAVGEVTGLKEPNPEWWQVNTTPETTDMTSAVEMAVRSLSATYGGKVIITSRLKIDAGGIDIPANRDNITFEGIAKGEVGKSISSLVGTAGGTILTINNNVNNILFKNLSLADAATVVLIPVGALIANLNFEDVLFYNISDKAIYLADTSQGSTGGIVGGSIHRCVFYDVKYGLYTVLNAMINNFYLDKCKFAGPKNGGYYVYIAGCNDSLITGALSIRDTLMNGTISTTNIPIYLGGRIGSVVLDNVQAADYGLTGGTNDGLELITLGGSTGAIGISSLVIRGSGLSNARGPVLNITATVASIMNLVLEGNTFEALSTYKIIDNANILQTITSLGNKYTADVRIVSPKIANWVGDIVSGTPLPESMGNSVARRIIKTVNTTPYAITESEIGSVFVATGAANIVFTLPTANTCPVGNSFVFKSLLTAAATVTINRNSSDLIDGAVNYVLTISGDVAELVPDGGTNWYAISRYITP